MSLLNKVWRIVIGVSLVPAFGTLYQRLTLPEATRYTEAQKVVHEEEELKMKQDKVTIRDDRLRAPEKPVEPHAKAQFSGECVFVQRFWCILCR